MRCRRCGYFEDVHEPATRKCPVCACGATPAEHYRRNDGSPICPALCTECGCQDKAEIWPVGGLSMQIRPHEHKPYRYGTGPDPLTLRRGTFDAADDGPMPIDRSTALILSRITLHLPEVMQADALAETDEVSGPPRVPARAPQSPLEIAGYGGKQAVGLGRHGMAAGWYPTALYWVAADGSEGCGVWLWRDDLRALATWKRPAGKAGTKSGWSGDIAYGWRIGSAQFPTKLNHTHLEQLIKGEK